MAVGWSTSVISRAVCLEPTTTGGSGDDDGNEIDETKTDYETYNGDDNEPPPPAGKTFHQALTVFVHVAILCLGYTSGSSPCVCTCTFSSDP